LLLIEGLSVFLSVLCLHWLWWLRWGTACWPHRNVLFNEISPPQLTLNSNDEARQLEKEASVSAYRE